MIHALHGFLGLPDDWNVLNMSCQTPDLHAAPAAGLIPWARRFNESIKEESTILIGYSMGGRLALHALLDSPEKWKAAVVISAHPGLASQAEREERLMRDHAWAKRFAQDKWETLMNDWDAQETLRSSQRIPRDEGRYSRKGLSECLQNYSLGHQEDLREALASLNIPILWIAGAKDKKHAAIASQIALKHPKSKVHILPGSGHRAPWDAPLMFQQTLYDFLQENPHA